MDYARDLISETFDKEEFEDTKSESVNRRRTDNTMAKRSSTLGHTTFYKTYTSLLNTDTR